jgi:xylulokinase
MKPVILAIDLGTTSLKCILVDESGATIDRESANQASRPLVSTWIANLAIVVTALQTRNPRIEIVAIAVTGQMHGTQFYDDRGEPVGECTIWTDRSTAHLLPDVLERLGPDLPTRIGSTIAPGFQALKLFATPNLNDYRKALLPKDTIIHYLTGRFVTDPTDAAGTGLFDGGHNAWARDVIDTLGIPRSLLPDVVPSGSEVGPISPEAADALNISWDVRIVIAGGDTPVAALAAGTTAPDQCQMMISTSAQVLIPATPWEPQPAALWYTWPAAGPLDPAGPRWLRSGTISNGGSVLDWFRSVMGPVDLAEIAPQPIIFLPHLAGRRFPIADAAVSGAFLGLRGTHTSAELSAAVLQGIAFTFREVFEAMTEASGQPARIRLGGGAAQTPGFANLLATVLDFPIERIAGSDLTCEGAAMLAAHRLGWRQRPDQSGEIVESDAARTTAFDRLYRVYLDANAAVTPIAHRLSALT